jgi:hypothetical protein
MDDAARRHGFARVLSKQTPELLPFIDWEQTEKRSLALVWAVFLATAFLLVGIGAGAWIYRDELFYALWIAPSFDLLFFILVIALVVATRATTGSIRRIEQELGKYPEVALFGVKAPIIYLREFGNENPDLDRSALDDNAAKASNFLGGHFFALAARLIISTDNSLENMLSKELSGLGPLLCLRDARQRRPIGGAFRMQGLLESWQTLVRNLLSRSALAFVHFGPSPAVSWEIEEVVQRSTKPSLIWIEYVVAPAGHPPGADYIDLFPKALTPLLRATGVTSAELGPHDDDRGFMFLVNADKSVFWRRPTMQWTSIKDALNELTHQARLKPVSNEQRRDVNTVGYRLSGALAGIISLLLMFCMTGVVASYGSAFFAVRDTVATATIACERGDTNVCYALSHEPRADRRHFSDIACGRGHVQACAELGALMLNETSSPEDRNAGLANLMFACNGGERLACDAIGEEGARLLQSAPETGIGYLRAACGKGSSASCGSLATIYWEGRLAALDYASARDYAVTACNGRQAQGCRVLALVYQYGAGVAADPARAREFEAQAFDIDRANQRSSPYFTSPYP